MKFKKKESMSRDEAAERFAQIADALAHGGEWAAPRFPDSVIGAISCCELPVQVLVEGLLRGPVPER
jgi:hypothetical protein